MARRFPDVRSALKAFEATRDLLLAENLDASVLRFTLDGQSHLAVLGEAPLPPESERRVKAAIEENSEAIALPQAVGEHLRQRRRAFKSTGLNYLERRTGGLEQNSP